VIFSDAPMAVQAARVIFASKTIAASACCVTAGGHFSLEIS
jgi:hypothetical protein